MIIQKYKAIKLNRIFYFAAGVFVLLVLLLPQTSFASSHIPAGCSGGPAGPPSPGTVCPDGSIPIKDGTLPLGCPGSLQQGPVGPDYEVTCPARPGRAECVYKQSTQKCEPTSDNGGGGAGTTYNLKGDCKQAAGGLNKDNCGIIGYIVLATNALTGLVGIIVTLMIAYGGIQYASARDNPQAAAAAKTRIQNAVIAFVMYLFVFTFLQWIIPGGLF
jgi:hypothetical protein